MESSNQSIVRARRSEISLGAPVIVGPPPSSQQLSLVDIWHTITKRKFAIIAFAAFGLCLAAVYTSSKTPVYEAVARVQIDPSRSSSLGLDDSGKSPDTTDTDVDSRIKTEIEIIQSDTVATQVVKSLGLYSDPEFAGDHAIGTKVGDFSKLVPSQRMGLLEHFKSGLSVRVIPDTQLVEIRFRSSDPALAAKVANSTIDEYMQRNFHTRVDGTTQVSQWLSSQLEEIRSATTASQLQLAEFQRRNNLLGTDERDNIVTDRLRQLNEELTQAEADRIVKEGRYRMASTGNPELIASESADPTLQALRAQQADLQAQYSLLSAKFGSGYPKLQELSSELASVNSEIDSERRSIETRLANEYDSAARAEAMVRDDFEKQKAEAYKLNENVAQYSILKHQVESGQELYDTVQAKLKEANVALGLSSSYISVVDRAQQPDQPVEPNKKVDLAAGLGLGSLGGLIVAFGFDSLDDTIHTSHELETLTALPELGSIPFVRAIKSKHRESLTDGVLTGAVSDFGPLSLVEPECAAADAYRGVCSIMLLSLINKPSKVLLVTSAMAGEGKSSVSCNLAIALAQRGLRVLLIDADLRCSSIQAELGRMPGLSTILSNDRCPDLRRQPLADLPNLDVIPAGFRPISGTEGLASSRMQQLLNAWRSEYDHIVIDTPPFLPFSDALVLSAHADGVILVTRSGISRNKALVRATDVLSRSGVNIIGFVLNGVKCPEYYYAYPEKYKRLTESNDSKDHKGSKTSRSKGAL